MEFPGRLRPTVAALLNLTPDHLERHGTMAAYGAAKCRLFARMGPEGLAVVPAGDAFSARLAEEAGGSAARGELGALPGAAVDHVARRATIRLPRRRRRAGAEGRDAEEAEEVEEGYDLSGLVAEGRHNELNAAAALLLARGLGASPPLLRAALPTLRPPPHRMEPAGDRLGLQWVDDSKATNVESAMAGIAGLRRPAVVLLGGQAKDGVAEGGGLGFGQLVPLLRRHRAVVCFGKDGARIAAELRPAGGAGPLV